MTDPGLRKKLSTLAGVLAAAMTLLAVIGAFSPPL